MGSILTKSCEHILEGGFLGAVQYEESKIIGQCKQRQASQVALVVKNHPANAGDRRDVGLIPGTGRSPGGGNGTSLQYSCLENPHGQRILVGYSPWGHKESDMTEMTKHTHIAD